jgi:hypothetical protein
MAISIAGSFRNGTPECDQSLLLAENDLTNGYRSGFDLTDAPDSLKPTGPEGCPGSDRCGTHPKMAGACRGLGSLIHLSFDSIRCFIGLVSAILQTDV